MKMKKKNKIQEENAGYWMSFSDLISAVLIVFMLLFIFKLFDYQQSMSEKQQLIENLTSTRSDIINSLKSEFENENIAIDSASGAITLSEGILFDFGMSYLKPEGKEFLQKVMPAYLDILLNNEEVEKVSQIIIEGHTDTSSTYIYNLKLSQERSFSVVEFLLSDEFQYINKDKLQKYLTANGRSFSDPVKDDNGNINESASRRVEIKFRLNEEETIFEIQKQLKKGID